MNERNVKDMNDQDFVNALSEHAEWARANEWETPITLGDDLAEAADRADRIEAQAKEIEKLRGQNKQLREAAALVAKESAELLERHWIPVAERLPEDRSNVLGAAYWHERWGVYMGWCAPERAEWSVHVGIGDRDDVAVTHWMPLPEPPEVENALEAKKDE